MTEPRDFTSTNHVIASEDLVSLLCEFLPESGVIIASSGEWRREAGGRWRFWQDPAWVPGDFEESPIPVHRENP